jgi:aldose 1-epimerase
MGFELALGDERLVVGSVGAALESWSVAGRELLDGPRDAHDDGAFRGKVLAPWPSRLRDGRYRFGGAEHRTALTEPARHNALHGLTTQRMWRRTHASSHRLVLAHDLPGEEGYPFRLRLEVSYELVHRGVVATLRATNAGDAPAPFGAGLHPYLRLEGTPVDNLLLELPARTRVPVDERLLPAGDPAPVEGTELDFRHARAIGPLALDTCFADLARDAEGIARVVLSAPGDDRRLTLWMDERFRFVQVYTGDTLPDPARRRGGVAIEPMTCAPDAFNSGDGLVVLAPGGSFSARCGLRFSG